MTLISNARYQKKRNESDIKMDFQNLVLFMMIGTKSSRSWGLLRNIFAIFINLSIFVWEYRTRRPVIPHVNVIYVTKPQTSHNTMQKTRPRYLNLERFYWGSVFARQKTKTNNSVHDVAFVSLCFRKDTRISKYTLWI